MLKDLFMGMQAPSLLLVFSLFMVEKPELFGIPDKALATRITFLLVGIWWLGFAQFTYRRLPNNVFDRKPEKDFIWKGLKELKIVLKELVNYPQLKYFLVSFFCFSVGVQTIVLMAGIFGSNELGLPTIKFNSYNYTRSTSCYFGCLFIFKIIH